MRSMDVDIQIELYTHLAQIMNVIQLVSLLFLVFCTRWLFILNDRAKYDCFTE